MLLVKFFSCLPLSRSVIFFIFHGKIPAQSLTLMPIIMAIIAAHRTTKKFTNLKEPNVTEVKFSWIVCVVVMHIRPALLDFV